MIVPTFNVNGAEFDRRMGEFVAASGKDITEAVRQQARLLGKEITQRTPPLDGKVLKAMTEARGLNRFGSQIQLRDSELGSMKARQIGERRVEKDISRIIFGLKRDEVSATRKAMSVMGRRVKKKGYSMEAVKTTGQIQKCGGTLAARIFATKSGRVYGTDLTTFRPNATIPELKEKHYAQRTKSGRVTTAGSGTRDIGRWRFLDMLVVKDSIKRRYVRLKQQMVGEAKGGWVSSMNALGANVSTGSWIGRHFRSGTYKSNLQGDKPSFTFINNSRWASARDPDRIIDKSMEGRAKAMAGQIRMMVKKQWRQRVKK